MKFHWTWNFLILFARIFINGPRAVSTDNFTSEQNVGTVLFEESESCKRCWSREDFIILNSRRMFQDLLPKVNNIDYNDDRYISLLMNYFHICLESVQKMSIGKTKHLVLKALADTMGGYLQAYILPQTRQSYYAGNIRYHNAKALFELYDDLKSFLRTNGFGWSKPKMEIKKTKIPPIVITHPKTHLACNGLITQTLNTKDKSSHFSMKRRKRCLNRRNIRNRHNRRYRRNVEETFIPIPYFDSDDPNSIALPLKKNSLLSLYSEQSAFAIVKYYVASVKCIMSQTNSREKLQTFNRHLFNWLRQSVLPYLETEKWYPAFGGILRIYATLEKTGVKEETYPERSGAHQAMSKIEKEYSLVPSERSQYDKGLKDKENENSDITFGTMEWISIALVSSLLLWLLVGLTLVCYRFRIRNSDEDQICKSQSPGGVKVLYENKGFKGLRGWWNSRFERCPGGCRNRSAEQERYLGSINYVSKDIVDVANKNKACQNKRHGKFTLTSPTTWTKGRISYRHRVCYSTDGSLSTNSDILAQGR